jgi:hypothetical protein
VLSVVLAYQVVGLGLWLAECATRVGSHPQVLQATHKQSLTVLCAAGTVLGLGAALWSLIRRAVRLRLPGVVLDASLWAVAAYALGVDLFSGALMALGC